ncbi:10391_t:CDS:2 [Entrophospora sp. SA101]|nr:12195_t:CDS:2 [Entrophospora sp. SA101]CAJ0748990.1 10391_t:CDS:2 [Entrophospora sp. SA101]CAJ0837262.1 3334_t:CDS:2 [Entrophospora sp. SA101]
MNFRNLKNIEFEFIKGGITIIVGENNVGIDQRLPEFRKSTSLLDLFSPDSSFSSHSSHLSFRLRESEGSMTLFYKIYYFDLTTSTSFLSKKEGFKIEKVKTLPDYGPEDGFIRHEEAGLVTYRGFNKDICHSLNKMGSGYLKYKTLESLVEDIGVGYEINRSGIPRSCFPTEIKSTILLIDEPELFLHPSLIADLASLIKRAAKNGVTVIFTTHSPDFLGHFIEDLSSEENNVDLIMIQRDENNFNLKKPLHFQKIIKEIIDSDVKGNIEIIEKKIKKGYEEFADKKRENVNAPNFYSNDDRNLDEKGNLKNKFESNRHEKFWRKYGEGKIKDKKGEILHSKEYNIISRAKEALDNLKKNDSAKLNIEPLVSARNFLHKALREAQSELEIAGTIQTFEVSYELAYKTCRKILSLRGTHVYTAKEVFRITGLEGLIPNTEPWFDYVDKRNITVHEYYEKIMEEVYPILPQFLKNLDLLIKNLKKL